MIYFVRHGHKAKGDYFNNTLRILDEPLSEEGLNDAARVAEYFSNIDIKRIIVSEYKRTYQTALPASLQKGIPITIDARVNEMHTGALMEMNEEQAAMYFPEFWKKILAHDCDMTFPGGECGEDVFKRQKSFLDDIKSETGGVLIVSHDGFIRILLCYILGLPPYVRYKFKTNMGGLTIIDFDKEEREWHIVRFNQVL